MRLRLLTTRWLLLALCGLLLTGLPPTVRAQAAGLPAALAEPTVTTLILSPTDDARTQPGSTDVTFEEGFLWMGQPNVHVTLLKFDLSTLPVDATIEAASVRLYFTGIYTGTNQIEVGRVQGNWDEATLTGSTPLTYTWGGQFQTVTSTGRGDGDYVSWTVTPLVRAWHNSAFLNDGVALRGNGGDLKAAHSKETGEANDLGPKLIITYTLPADDGQPRPDLGDAPDSTNHHGINNTAYLGGTLGQFPTVYNVPANQAAGPRHNNQTMQAWLGDFLSREGEADQGPDQDAPRNNILRNSVTGATGDVADNDRGDDGWRNRNLRFFPCERTQLAIRVSKAPNATLNRMYLNVWFDGNRDGDWADLGQCPPEEEGPAQASYEWIVQNYIVDLTAIPAGGSLDFNIPTQKLLNSSLGRHWMRFTLSDTPAVQPLNGTDLPDGRGPHPQHPTLQAFAYGETEDLLQTPAPAGQEGTLQIQKMVITDGEPVEWIDYVTYQIRLRHNGGTQSMQARLRDVLPYPLIVYPTVNAGGIDYVTVESPTGGATPLQAQLEVIPPNGTTPPQQVIKWQGVLAPNAELLFTFQVRVLALCEANQQTMTFTNTAQALPKNGTVVTGTDTFTAKCINYDESNVDLEVAPVDNPNSWDGLNDLTITGILHNRHAVSVTLGLYQQALGTATAARTALTSTPPLKLEQITLQPGETKPFAVLLHLDDQAEQIAGEDEPVTQLAFCLIVDSSGDCPNAALYPKLHGRVPVLVHVRPADLGDAPDSTNHFAAPMTAYPGVPANFPTVFDPTTGLPQGPRHLHPRPFHLGQRVSRELGTDLGPDQDGINNLGPAANDADNDRFDDGARLRNLANCQPAAVDLHVAIAPLAVNYFRLLERPAYLNVWIDSNRDGDWADGFTCQDAQGQNQAVVEHILIDQPINVLSLGAGLHSLANLVTQRVAWPAELANRPVWVRFTLSERPASKPLSFGGIQYGDGRGDGLAFTVGETEDDYRTYAGNGVDLAVQVSASTQTTAQQAADLQAAAVDQLGNFEIQLFKVEVANVGATDVTNALLEFQIPEKFRGVQPRILRTPGVTSESISFNFDKLSFVLPHLEQEHLYTVVLGWYGCITCTVASQASAPTAESTGVATVTAAGDSDTSNNQSSATARTQLRTPSIGAFMDYTDDSCMDHIVSGHAATNRTTLALRGQAAPNQIIAILIGLLKAGEVTTDAQGNFSYTVQLTPGLHTIRARYADQIQRAGAQIISPRDPQSGLPTGQLRLLVNPALPYDPISACFTDSNGRSFFAPTLGVSNANQAETFASTLLLKAGASYRLSIYGKGTNANAALDAGFTLVDDLINETVLRDLDGDGLFTGLVTLPASLQAAQVGTAQATPHFVLTVADGANVISYSNAVTLTSDGIVTNRVTGQPVANVSVAALLAQSSDAGVIYSAPAAQALGQANPTLTAANGGYSFSLPNGIYRLDLAAAGYQPYRTADLAVTNGLLAQSIALSPVIAEAATQQLLITADGFAPAQLNAKVNDVIEFVNVDLTDHNVSSSLWDSGLLAPGQSYKVKVSQLGTVVYGDSTDASSQGTLIVGDGSGGSTIDVYLPLVQR